MADLACFFFARDVLRIPTKKKHLDKLDDLGFCFMARLGRLSRTLKRGKNRSLNIQVC